MSERRRGLGKGLGALIPSAPSGDRPADVFFPRNAPPAGVGTLEPEQEPDGVPAGDDGFTGNHVGHSGPGGQRASGSEDRFTGNSAYAHPSADGEAAGSAAGDAVSGTHEGLEGLAPVPGAHFAELPVDSIRPNPRQPRQVFDEDDLAELVASISELGVLQPVVVRPVAPDEVGDGAAPYELVMGERRLRASREAGRQTVPAIVRSTGDEHMLRDALLENLHRASLNPLEEAAAYQQLLEDFGCTHEELATRIGRSRPQISNMIRLLKLPPLVQRRVASGVLTAGHARALLGLQDGAAMERLAQRIVAEGLSVRTVEEIVLLGEDGAPAPRRRPARAAASPELQQVASDLSARLDTRVQVSMGRHKGKITVEFAGQDDLQRILGALASE
jgi:ParB family transcriptional regulator, chromosome partitioning protein